MRTLLIGLLGGVLLMSGLAAGVGGLGLQIADPCSDTYRLETGSIESVADPPDETRAFESLTEYQQRAVSTSVSNRTRVTFRRRAPLEALVGDAIGVEGRRYVVTGLVESPCRDFYDELAIGGFVSATVGAFVALYAGFRWWQS